MEHSAKIHTTLRRIAYLIFGLQLTLVGVHYPDLFPLVVLGFGVSIISLLHPASRNSL